MSTHLIYQMAIVINQSIVVINQISVAINQLQDAIYQTINCNVPIISTINQQPQHINR